MMTVAELRMLDELLTKYHNTIGQTDYPEQSYRNTRVDTMEQVSGSLLNVESALDKISF